jgi:DNA-binding LacI/PurR family transcriptional regulator/signal transduction histidine kinase
MSVKPGKSKFKHSGIQKGRLTIGYLIPWVHDPIFIAMWSGVDDIMRKYGINLICFAGAPIQFPDKFVRQRNMIYDLITGKIFDGLIMVSAALSIYISPEELDAFRDRFRQLPVVSIGKSLKGIPSITVDNERGIRSLVKHLVETHNLSRIAFIRGPAGHQEAEQRYHIFKELLARYGIPLNPDCIMPGDFSRESGAEAVRILLDQRKLLPGKGFEAIVAANDEMALGALAVLQARKIHVPNDVALAGFDDREDAKYVLPPLTTVRNPLYQLGVRASEMLIARIEGRQVPESMVLPSELVIRQSCGCLPPIMVRSPDRPVYSQKAADGPASSQRETSLSRAGLQEGNLSDAGQQEGGISKTSQSAEDYRTSLTNRLEGMLPALKQALAVSLEEAGCEWAGQLWDAFVREIVGKEPGCDFLAVLWETLYQKVASTQAEAYGQIAASSNKPAAPGKAEASDFDIYAWQNMLSVLHDHSLPYLSCDEAIRAKEILGRARVLVSDVAERLHGQQDIQKIKHTQILSEIDYELSTTFNMTELLDAAVREIPRSGIQGFYITLFDDPEAPADWSRLLLAYDGKQRIESRARVKRFPTRQLLPDGLLLQDKRYSLVLEMLYVRDRPLGLILFEAKPSQGPVCRVLWRQIGGALWGVLLLQARDEAEAALEKAYKELKAAQKELIRKERLATLGKVAATVSHELRNPLATIRILASTIDRKTRGKSPADKILGLESALSRLQRNITRCDAIISELLDYTRMPDLHLRSVYFDGWLNHVLDEQVLPGGITLKRHLVSGAEVSMDPERFRRLIINLVENACQAILQLPEKKKQARILKVQSRIVEGRLEIVISDTGVGIPPDVMPHIFEPLFSTKSFGIGLGLSVVEEIAIQHGGDIKITSNEGKGTQAVVMLPLNRQENESG